MLGQGVPVFGGAFGAAVIVTEDYPAGSYYFEGLGGFAGEAVGLVASVAEDDSGGGVVRGGVPGVDALEDLLDFALQRLIPIEKTYFVLAWDWRKVEGDYFTVWREVQGQIQCGAALGGAKFDYAFGLEEFDDVGEDHQLVRLGTQAAREGMEELGRVGEVNLRKELLDRNLGHGQVLAPGEGAPHPREAVTGVHAVREGDVFLSAAGAAGGKSAEGVEVECG